MRSKSVRLDAPPAPGGIEPAWSASEPLALPSPAADVDVWICGLVRSRAQVDELAAALSAAERARAARFGRDDLRDRYVVGRATLRHAARPPARARTGRRRDRARHARAPVRRRRERPRLQRVAHGRRGAHRDDRRRSHRRRRRARERANSTSKASRASSWRPRAARAGRPRARRAPPRAAAAVDLQGSDEQGDRRRAVGAVPPARASRPARRLRLADGPPPYVPADWRLLPVAMPGGFLGTVALWRQG